MNKPVNIVMRYFQNTLMRVFLLACLIGSPAIKADALEQYINQIDEVFRWSTLEVKKHSWGTVSHYQLYSQLWRQHQWAHQLLIVKPEKIRNADVVFFRITGDGKIENHIHSLKTLAQRAGAITAVLSNVPNQPLYQGRKEDALIAYTFNQYLKTGEQDWPLLFPMVKSAVKGMDAIQQIVSQQHNQEIQRFVLSGASKRGWATWLTAAVDKRITAIAPMVIDTLNMKAQLQWSEQVYGKQSLKIKDYTELNLHRKLDNAMMQKLRSWVDPYSYIKRFTMPKLLLLGTNDPYWTVDSLRHYWDQLPEPKLIYQTPNAGHNLNGGKEALQTMAAFFEIIADKKPLPQVNWQFDATAETLIKTSQPAENIRLWYSYSEDRDFRDNQWTSQLLDINQDGKSAKTETKPSQNGYYGYLMEVELQTDNGHPFKLSSSVQVLPDTKPCHCWKEQVN